jgi:hypothetical protein
VTGNWRLGVSSLLWIDRGQPDIIVNNEVMAQQIPLTFTSSLVVSWRKLLSQLQTYIDRWPLRWQFSGLDVGALCQASPKSAHLADVDTQSARARSFVLPTADAAVCASDVSIMRHSYYVGDMLRALYPHFLSQRFLYEFGDVNWILPKPAFVKSRPISNDNHNKVLLPLDMRRHLRFPTDPYDFDMKKSGIVWRGASHQANRQVFLKHIAPLPFCDAGNPALQTDDPQYRPWLSVFEQLQFKYIVSIEGNDVATNLKWILNSQSLCMMPKTRFETWFLESRLQAGVHYVELADDFSDIADVFAYYETHPNEAQQIIRQANAYTQQYANRSSERLISQHVAQAYFAANTNSTSARV